VRRNAGLFSCHALKPRTIALRNLATCREVPRQDSIHHLVEIEPDGENSARIPSLSLVSSVTQEQDALETGAGDSTPIRDYPQVIEQAPGVEGANPSTIGKGMCQLCYSQQLTEELNPSRVWNVSVVSFIRCVQIAAATLGDLDDGMVYSREICMTRS